MMYNNGLVAVVVSNGNIVREIGGTVYIPFGSEYSLRFKNNKNQRAVVSVFVDGKDAMNGNQLVVDANAESEIKGFLENGSMAKNAFRFIEKTENISKHRGDKIDDGIIRIEFQYEIPLPVYNPYKVVRSSEIYPPSRPWDSQPVVSFESNSSSPLRGSIGSRNSMNSMNSVMNENQTLDFSCSVSQNESGITVAGSHVNQKFSTTYTRSLETQKHVIVFELKGAKSNGEPINQPILTRTKTECPTCGRKCKSSAKFCSECSTCLV